METPFSFRMLRGRALLAIGLVSGLAHAAPFTLSRDTVDLRADAPRPEFDFLANAGVDSLTIDSVTARLLSNVNMAHLRFLLRVGPTSAPTRSQEIFAQGHGPNPMIMTQATRFRVGPQASARLAEPL